MSRALISRHNEHDEAHQERSEIIARGRLVTPSPIVRSIWYTQITGLGAVSWKSKVPI